VYEVRRRNHPPARRPAAVALVGRISAYPPPRRRPSGPRKTARQGPVRLQHPPSRKRGRSGAFLRGAFNVGRCGAARPCGPETRPRTKGARRDAGPRKRGPAPRPAKFSPARRDGSGRRCSGGR
jgi:hypothetical protein